MEDQAARKVGSVTCSARFQPPNLGPNSVRKYHQMDEGKGRGTEMIVLVG